MTPEYALSVRQPWAWLMCHPDGLKDIENRTWRIGRKPGPGLAHVSFALTLPARVYIHAGKTVDKEDFPDICRRAKVLGLTEVDIERLDANLFDPANRGAIIGEVTITACVTEHPSPWFEGPFGFVCRDPVLYPIPIPCPGRLGFWKPEVKR